MSRYSLTGGDLEVMMEHVCRRISEKKDWLSELDAACGDGDHGVSVARGFVAVAEQLSASQDLDPSAMLRKAGMALISATGGAAGPLLGTFFVEAGNAIAERQEISAADLAAMFDAGLAGICKRGGAKPGDKTMVDALLPAVEALHDAVLSDLSVDEALTAAVVAARMGAESTRDMLPKQGKSRYLGERALGCADAGAYTIVVITEALAESARALSDGPTMETDSHGNEKTD